jgi:hypothetical protein
MSLRRFAGLIVCVCLSWASPARADVVVDWNAIAAQTISAVPLIPPRPGPSVILDFAMIHAAMHDAIQATDKRFESYAISIEGASGSPIAAAATAAHDVLAARFPPQAAALHILLDNYLGGLGLTGDAGMVSGHQAAAAILNLRNGDGSFPATSEVFVGGTGPGQWRPTPPAFAPMAAPWLGAVAPFTLKASDQLSASPPPPHLGSGEYAKDYEEVKALGRAGSSSARTPAQTDLALFYSDNFITLWERTLRGIASANVNNIGDSGRLFALANLAAADAIITAWHDKRFWAFWRPITAIQQGDNDGNPRTVGDPTWVPYLVTPPYSDYTSGANNLTGSMTRTLELFFGDKTTFSVFSTTANTTFFRHGRRCGGRAHLPGHTLPLGGYRCAQARDARGRLGLQPRLAFTSIEHVQNQEFGIWNFRIRGTNS